MESKSKMLYSVIIPSYNRVDELRELFETIAKLNFPKTNFEIIVADDGSTDTTAELIKEVQEKNLFTLHYFTQQKKGPGAARNLGMEKANGDYFIFIDSDVLLPEDWLQNIANELETTGAEAFGGPDTYLESFPPLLKAINYSMTSFITTGGLRGKKGKKLAKYYPRSFNMGLSRSLWEKIGGFGTLRHGQDIEFSNRIIKSGANVAFIADAGVYHKRRTSIRRFYRQVFNWGVARVNLYQIDRSMFEPLHAVPAVITFLVLLVLLLAPFSDIFRFLLISGFISWILLSIILMIGAIRMYKQFLPAVYLLIVTPVQVLGYGLGFIYNFVRRNILKKDLGRGFTKNYYK